MRRYAAGAGRADRRRLPGIRAGVQGSTYFYGQKVGRLLDAAVDVLQLIASKRQRAALKAQARGSQQAADAALEQEALLDDEARFLCLDDVLDEAHDIDLPDAEAWGGAPTARPTHAQLLRRPDLLLLMEDLLQREAPDCGATAGDDPAGLAAGPGVAGEAMLPAGLPRLAMLSGPPGERSDVSDEDSTLPTWNNRIGLYIQCYIIYE